MSASSAEVPDLGAYTSHTQPGAHDDEDDEVLAELEREVEALNEADADDAAHMDGNSSGRSTDGDLSKAFQDYRAQRLAEIHTEVAARAGADTSDPDCGKYKEVRDEKELLSMSVREPKVVIHFAKPEFRRCRILDRHLEHMARQHPSTLFLKADVERTPFLVNKLEIRVLPCLFVFRNGVCKDKLIGFQDFGNSDAFTTAALEWRLGQTGVIVPQQKPNKPILGFGVPQSSQSAMASEDDWD